MQRAIVGADEAPFRSDAERYKACIANDNALQSLEFGNAEFLIAGLSDCLAPTDRALGRRSFILDGKR